MTTNSDFNMVYKTPAQQGQEALSSPADPALLARLRAEAAATGGKSPVYPSGVVQQGPARAFGNMLMKLPGVRNITESVYGYDPYNQGAQSSLSTSDRVKKFGVGLLDVPTLNTGTDILSILGLGEPGGSTKYAMPKPTLGAAAVNTPGTMTQADFKALQARNMADVKAQVAGRSYIENMQLSPAETLAYDQAIEQLRRSAGQASATAALSQKQARAEAGRGIADIRAFTSGAGQDVLSGLASAGMGDISAGAMGAARGLAAREATGVAAVKQNLSDYLAKQKLSAGQRGSDVSYGLNAINDRRAADLLAQQEAAKRGLLGGN